MPSQTEKRLPLLPLRGGLLLPGQTLAIPVGRRRSRRLLAAVSRGEEILVVAQRDAQVQDPTIADLFTIATRAVVRGVRNDDRVAHILVEGLSRQKLLEVTQRNPHLIAAYKDLPNRPHQGKAKSAESLELVDAAHALLEELKEEADKDTSATLSRVEKLKTPGPLADALTHTLGVPFEVAIDVLVTLDGDERLRRLLKTLDELEVALEVKRDVDNRFKEDVAKTQREHILRARMKAIQDELGDDDDDELSDLKRRLAEKDLPEEVQRAADKELGKLGRSAGPEQGVVRNYLEWIADLPWSERADETEASISDVAEALDENHRGLADVKERVLEHLAVRKQTAASDVTILCLAGPPGTGKTSLGQSVADALDRPLVRVALGGVRDEAEIRGHRRTYVGARPGRIAHALKKAAVKNPVFLLDEIDKMGRGWAGDPEAALLEVLDPEQNTSFVDHYLELPLDLSEVLFICTANDLSKLSAPLRDRLEIIELSGYVTEEKIDIAREHLIPRALARIGLEQVSLDVDEVLLRSIIEGWTREAGVRQLTRAFEKIGRRHLLKIARHDVEAADITLSEDDVKDALGKKKFFPEVKERTSLPGIATGLAWTPVGGDILFIETSRSRGKGRLEVTGQLGDVMSESARAALSWVKANDDTLGFDAQDLEEMDLHIHVPQGAVPKDGPSAGVALITALSSLLSGRKVRSDTAMTGELTLRGKVLPVGGIKAKVLAAHRAGIERIVLPKKNEADLDEIPAEVRNDLDFFLVEDVASALKETLSEAEAFGTDALTDDGAGLQQQSA